jgi:hypothetical protein
MILGYEGTSKHGRAPPGKRSLCELEGTMHMQPVPYWRSQTNPTQPEAQLVQLVAENSPSRRGTLSSATPSSAALCINLHEETLAV